MQNKIIYILIIATHLLGQGLNLDITNMDNFNNEVSAINNAEINEELFMFPVREKIPSKSYYNIFHKISKTVKAEPVLAFRFSSSGFELDSINTPGSVIWITPGVKISSTFPLISPMSGIWIYAWGRFHKHSAYGFNGNKIDIHDLNSEEVYNGFIYSPYFSTEYVVNTEKPKNGIDFDEGQGGIALISKKTELVFGKFKSNLGPFARGNLSISTKSPSFQQFRFHTNISDKFHFTYLVGSLTSNISDSSLSDNYLNDNKQNRLPQLSRYVIQHRLDILPKENFRIGLYEQIITGGKLSLNYLNPLMPFWSAQHANGDIDNLQMGFDWEWIIKNTRLYGAFYMDEWSPYKTFSNENHNWFAWQFGLSKPLKQSILLKIEYANLKPQIYTHKFDINISEHNGHPIGFWSGGDSDDFIASLHWFKNHNLYSISYELTHFGIPTYGVDVISQKNKLREKFTIISNVKLLYNFRLKASLSKISTENIYDTDNFIDGTISILYNISY